MISREQQIRDALSGALMELGLDGASVHFNVERPAIEEHGDFSSNVAMVCAKTVGTSPRELAERIISTRALTSLAHLDRLEVAGPGFINLYLSATHLYELLLEVLGEGEATFARSDLGGGERVLLEFVSANPTGPLHIGNGWWASYGDALGRVLDRAGFDVSREYYVNDTGGQIRALGESVLARKHGTEPPESGYNGAYVTELAARYVGPDEVTQAGQWAAKENLDVIRASLERLDIRFDQWFSQASIEESGAVASVIDELAGREAIFEKEGALWLESTRFGDNRDRVVRKSNGDFTYLAGDIAYHYNKFVVRGFERVIDIFGADHHGQVASLKAAVFALGIDPERLEIKLGQMISLEDKGEKVKLSKRAGTAVPLEWLIDEVGPAVTKILALSGSIDRASTIDLEKAKESSSENPAYYVQYAFARTSSMDRRRQERGIEKLPLDEVDLTVLTHPRELRLMRELVLLPEVVEIAAIERAPHKVTTWVKSLAAAFHGFYHDCPVLAPDVDRGITQARLVLTDGARVGMQVALLLLGVDAPEEM